MADEKISYREPRDDYIDFDWKSHRNTLDDVFFTDKDVIKRLSSITFKQQQSIGVPS